MDALATIPQYLVGAAVLLIAFRELRGLLDTILKRDHSGARSAKVYVDRQLSDVL